MADGSVCMAEVFWCMVLKGSSRQALPQGCTVDPSWRTANGKREREAGKLSASRVAETGKWHQREQTGGHNWEKKRVWETILMATISEWDIVSGEACKESVSRGNIWRLISKSYPGWQLIDGGALILWLRALCWAYFRRAAYGNLVSRVVRSSGSR